MMHILAYASLTSYQKEHVGESANVDRPVWKGENTLKVARKFYQCPFMDGVPLNSHTPHWSELYLNDEMITPTAMNKESERVSPMTLALLHDSGWYIPTHETLADGTPHYKFTENYTYNKGKGCQVFNPCPTPHQCEVTNDDEDYILAPNMTSLGVCKKDATGCPKIQKIYWTSCLKPADWSPDHQEWVKSKGGHYNDNCTPFMVAFGKPPAPGFAWSGNYDPSKTYNVIPTGAVCNATGDAYTVTYKNMARNANNEVSGDANIQCTAAGIVEFNVGTEYLSRLKCWDPKKFCGERYADGCDDSCTNNGRCLEQSSGHGQCWCYDQMNLAQPGMDCKGNSLGLPGSNNAGAAGDNGAAAGATGGEETATGNGNATDTNAGNGSATDTNAGNGNATDTNAGNGNATDTNAGNGNATDTNAGNGNATDTNANNGNAANTNTGDGNSATGNCPGKCPASAKYETQIRDFFNAMNEARTCPESLIPELNASIANMSAGSTKTAYEG